MKIEITSDQLESIISQDLLWQLEDLEHSLNSRIYNHDGGIPVFDVDIDIDIGLIKKQIDAFSLVLHYYGIEHTTYNT